jgi:hypothetical protein
MARMKLTTRKHVHAPPRRKAVPTESHSDGQDVGYFPRTLRTVLLALGSSKPPLFIGTSRLLCGNSYHWRVHVVIYERPTTDRIRRICQVVIELVAICKKLMEDTQRLEEEKATLEEMVESCDELLMEIARETGLDRMGEDEDEEEEEEYANDGGDVATPLTDAPPPPVPLLSCLNSSTRSSRLRVVPVAVPMVLWSLPLFYFIKSRLCLLRHYLCNTYTLYL